jgi:hypothetical protein
VKDSQDVYVIFGDDVGDSIVAIQKNPDITLWFIPIFMAKFWEIAQELSFFLDAGNEQRGRS